MFSEMCIFTENIFDEEYNKNNKKSIIKIRGKKEKYKAKNVR